MGVKYRMGHCLSISWLQKVYRERGVAHVVTDGAYVQVVTEGIKKDPQGCNPKGQ